MWIAIGIDDVKEKVAGAELAALRTAALSGGQPDPVVAIIGEVVNEVRGYVAACSRNVLGAGATIPDKLKSAALSMVRYRAATRLPGKPFLNDERIKENESAIRLLEQVANCKFAIDEPDVASTEVISMPRPSISSNERVFDRTTQDG